MLEIAAQSDAELHMICTPSLQHLMAQEKISTSWSNSPGAFSHLVSKPEQLEEIPHAGRLENIGGMKRL